MYGGQGIATFMEGSARVGPFCELYDRTTGDQSLASQFSGTAANSVNSADLMINKQHQHQLHQHYDSQARHYPNQDQARYPNVNGAASDNGFMAPNLTAPWSNASGSPVLYHERVASPGSASGPQGAVKPSIPASLQRRIAKTKICVHNMHGRCTRASRCLFAHSQEELREPPNLYKTRLCIAFMTTKSCARGAACKFAHGEQELRWTAEFYKTSICPYWREDANSCPAGVNCRYAHGVSELRCRRPLTGGDGTSDGGSNGARYEVDVGIRSAPSHCGQTTGDQTPLFMGNPFHSAASRCSLSPVYRTTTVDRPGVVKGVESGASYSSKGFFGLESFNGLLGSQARQCDRTLARNGKLGANNPGLEQARPFEGGISLNREEFDRGEAPSLSAGLGSSSHASHSAETSLLLQLPSGTVAGDGLNSTATVTPSAVASDFLRGAYYPPAPEFSSVLGAIGTATYGNLKAVVIGGAVTSDVGLEAPEVQQKRDEEEKEEQDDHRHHCHLQDDKAPYVQMGAQYLQRGTQQPFASATKAAEGVEPSLGSSVETGQRPSFGGKQNAIVTSTEPSPAGGVVFTSTASYAEGHGYASRLPQPPPIRGVIEARGSPRVASSHEGTVSAGGISLRSTTSATGSSINARRGSGLAPTEEPPAQSEEEQSACNKAKNVKTVSMGGAALPGLRLGDLLMEERSREAAKRIDVDSEVEQTEVTQKVYGGGEHEMASTRQTYHNNAATTSYGGEGFSSLFLPQPYYSSASANLTAATLRTSPTAPYDPYDEKGAAAGTPRAWVQQTSDVLGARGPRLQANSRAESFRSLASSLILGGAGGASSIGFAGEGNSGLVGPTASLAGGAPHWLSMSPQVSATYGSSSALLSYGGAGAKGVGNNEESSPSAASGLPALVPVRTGIMTTSGTAGLVERSPSQTLLLDSGSTVNRSTSQSGADPGDTLSASNLSAGAQNGRSQINSGSISYGTHARGGQRQFSASFSFVRLYPQQSCPDYLRQSSSTLTFPDDVSLGEEHNAPGASGEFDVQRQQRAKLTAVQGTFQRPLNQSPPRWNTEGDLQGNRVQFDPCLSSWASASVATSRQSSGVFPSSPMMCSSNTAGGDATGDGASIGSASVSKTLAKATSPLLAQGFKSPQPAALL